MCCVPSARFFLFGRVVDVHDGLIVVELFPHASGFHPELPTQLLYGGNKGLEFAQIIGAAHPCALPEALVAVVCIPQRVNQVPGGCAGVQELPDEG